MDYSILSQEKIGQDLKLAKNFLEKEQLVGIPTETVYGLAGNAYSANAVQSIFRVKNRPFYDPLIVHAANYARTFEFVEYYPWAAEKLAMVFWPGPLTLVLPKKTIISDLVTSNLPNVAVRIPNHPLTLELLSLLDFPLAAPSANPFQYVSPTTALHVAEQLGDKIPYIIDGGNCDFGIESTIVGFPNDIPTIYRLGSISVEAIQEKIGYVEVQSKHQPIKITSNTIYSPGNFAVHYSPLKPLFLAGDLNYYYYTLDRVGYIAFQIPHPEIPIQNQYILSPSGNLFQAAYHLYAALRLLDKQPLDAIFIELLPSYGIGCSINDRIIRACNKTYLNLD